MQTSLQKIKDITSAAQRAINEGRPAAAREALDEMRQPPRVQASGPSAPRTSHSSAVPTLQQPPAPRVQVGQSAPRVQIGQSVPRVQPAQSADAPIASRTRAGRAIQQAAKESATRANQGPAHNTRSKSCAALERALQTACFLDKKQGDAKRLAGRKFSPGMFRAAFAVMELGSGKMLKHRQLINHEDSEIRATWSTLSANKFGRLF